VATSVDVHLQKQGGGRSSAVQVSLVEPGLTAIRTRLKLGEGISPICILSRNFVGFSILRNLSIILFLFAGRRNVGPGPILVVDVLRQSQVMRADWLCELCEGLVFPLTVFIQHNMSLTWIPFICGTFEGSREHFRRYCGLVNGVQKTSRTLLTFCDCDGLRNKRLGDCMISLEYHVFSASCSLMLGSISEACKFLGWSLFDSFSNGSDT